MNLRIYSVVTTELEALNSRSLHMDRPVCDFSLTYVTRDHHLQVLIQLQQNFVVFDVSSRRAVNVC